MACNKITKNINMKQLLFLLLFPCLALAQYPANGNQKISLGEQTTADGLVYRGVANDTNVITPFSDTSAYIILDTVNSKFYHYNRTTTYWALAGGGVSVTSFSAGTTGLTPTGETTGAVTLGGTLAVANGGTNAGEFTQGSVVFAGASGTYTQDNSGIFYDNTDNRIGIGTASPDEKLHIIGQIRMTGATIASGLTKNISISGAQNFIDDEVKTISAANVTFIMVADNNTGAGALFFASYISGTIVKIADPTNICSVSDEDGFICVYKSASTFTINVKNRSGSTKNITVSQIMVGD
jgi:hypothetical protein